MAQVHKNDEKDFLRSLYSAASVNVEGGDQLFMYFCVSDGTGAAECFVRHSNGRVQMIDPERGMFDFLYADWLSAKPTPEAAWTWGWAKYSADGSAPELCLENQDLSDIQVVGMQHALDWRSRMFGNTKIENPAFE